MGWVVVGGVNGMVRGLTGVTWVTDWSSNLCLSGLGLSVKVPVTDTAE